MGHDAITFDPDFLNYVKNREQVAARRRRYVANSMPETESVHRCKVCGHTEADDPGLELRVAADDEEYCLGHLPR